MCWVGVALALCFRFQRAELVNISIVVRPRLKTFCKSKHIKLLLQIAPFPLTGTLPFQSYFIWLGPILNPIYLHKYCYIFLNYLFSRNLFLYSFHFFLWSCWLKIQSKKKSIVISVKLSGNLGSLWVKYFLNYQ